MARFHLCSAEYVPNLGYRVQGLGWGLHTPLRIVHGPEKYVGEWPQHHLGPCGVIQKPQSRESLAHAGMVRRVFTWQQGKIWASVTELKNQLTIVESQNVM